MDDRKVLEKAVKADPMNEALRFVYADWLEEHAEPEQADLQRHYVSSVLWMQEFAKKHHCFGKYHNWEQETVAWNAMTLEQREEEIEHGDLSNPYETAGRYYRDFMEFLDGHQNGGDRMFGFDLPYDFKEYSDEMWRHYEIITGRSAPSGVYRKKMPPMSCAC